MKGFIYSAVFCCFLLAIAYGNECTSCDTDVPPTADHVCDQQAKWNKCGEPFMKGFCCKSCSPKCQKTDDSTCSNCDSDIPPTADHACDQQAKWNKCGEPFMKGFCCKSCSQKCAKP